VRQQERRDDRHLEQPRDHSQAGEENNGDESVEFGEKVVAIAIAKALAPYRALAVLSKSQVIDPELFAHQPLAWRNGSDTSLSAPIGVQTITKKVRAPNAALMQSTAP